MQFPIAADSKADRCPLPRVPMLPAGVMTERLHQDMHRLFSFVQPDKPDANRAARIWVTGPQGTQAMSHEQFDRWR